MAVNPKNTLISDVTENANNLVLKVRVVRMWLVPEFTNPQKSHSLELVLQDSEGNRIHATAKKTLIYRFQKQIREDVVYTVSLFNVIKNTGEYRTTHHNFKIDILYDTKFERADNSVVPLTIYNFTTPAEIFEDAFNRDYLVDVIGVLTAVGKEREYVKNGGHKIHAIVGSELINKFKFSLKEEGVYIMYNFRVTNNEIQEVMTTSHKYVINFTNKTKIRPVDHGLVPNYSYFFTHLSVFLSNGYKFEVLVDEFHLS